MGVNTKNGLNSKKTAFLDRDGTLIEYKREVTKHPHIKLFPFSAEAVRRLNGLGYLVIMHTNQPIIEKGIVTREEVDALNDYIKKELARDGAHIDGMYVCPHRYGGTDCICRKPNIGLIEDAQRDFSIDMTRSWLVGDTARDMETGKRAGLRTILVMTGDGDGDERFFETKGEFEADNILEAVEVIERESR